MACGSCLKCGVYASVALFIVIGIVIEIIFLILAYGHFAEATESKTGLIVSGTIVLIVLLLIAVIGCCGVSRRSTCLLLVYTIITALMFVGFWIVFGYMKKGKGNMHDDIEAICRGEDKSDFIRDLDKIYDNNLNTVFCTAQCRCKADPAKFTGPEYTGALFDQNNGASLIADCGNNPIKDEKKTLLSFLGWLEEEMDCSGICTKQRFYYFSDVNRGPPPKECKMSILDYLDSKFFM